MASILVTAETDSKEWSVGIANLVADIKDATANASMDAAELIGSIAKGKLHEREHGPLTFSPSPRGAGQPPATVSGDLAESIIAVSAGGTAAMVGPTTKYGRIQELGGTMEGHPFMVFTKQFADKGIVTFKKRFVTLTPRPYLEPSTEDAVNSGRVRDIYAHWWAQAIEAGAG